MPPGRITADDGGSAGALCCGAAKGASKAHCKNPAYSPLPRKGGPQNSSSTQAAAAASSDEAFAAYFAQARVRVDIGVWVLCVTLFGWVCSTRALQTLCLGPWSSSSSRQASVPLISTAAPTIWVPHTSSSIATILKAMPAAGTATPAASAAGHYVNFPCALSPPLQLAWAVRHYPFVFIQTFLLHRSFLAPICLLLGLVSLPAVLLWPRCYVTRGRTPLVLAFVALARLAPLMELLLMGPDNAPVTRVLTDALQAGFARGPSTLMVQQLVLPVPGPLQPVLAMASLVAVVIKEALLLGPAATWAYLWRYTACAFVLGVILPGLLQQQFEHSLKAQFRARQQHTNTDSSGTMLGSKLLSRCMGCLDLPYKRHTARACHVGVKVHHHEAFSHRNAIRDELEAYLHAHLAPATGSSSNSASTSTQRTPPVVMALSTVMVQGCLQLLLTAHAVPTADAGHAAGANGGGSDSAAWCQHLRGVPAVIEAALQRQIQALQQRFACQMTVSGSAEGAHSVGEALGGVASQLAGPAAASMRLVPLCVEAGVAGGQEVMVEVEWAQGRVAQQGAVGAEVAVSVWQGGEQVVLRQPLRDGGGGLDASSTGAACGDACRAGCWVQLPPQLDAAPVEVHLVADLPHLPGVLLASATTMALPPAAARELLAALPPDTTTSNSQIVSSVVDMLEDVAVAWQLLQSRQLPNTLGAMLPARASAGIASLTHVSAYCADRGLPCMVDYLSTLPPDTPPAAATPNTGSDAGSGLDAADEADQSPSCGGGTAPMQGQAAGRAQRTAAVEPGSRSSSCIASNSSGGGSGSGGGGCGSCSCASGAGWEERYAAWKLQQGRGIDLMVVASIFLLEHNSAQRLPPGPAPTSASTTVLPMAALDLALVAGPWVVLALGSARLRQRRAAIIALQAGLMALRFLAAAACLLPQPRDPQQGTQLLGACVGAAVFLPALHKVGWRQQLLCSFFLQEAPRYIMQLAATTTCASAMAPGAAGPSLLSVGLVPLTAAAVAWALECRSRANFRRVVAQEPQAGSCSRSGKAKSD